MIRVNQFLSLFCLTIYFLFCFLDSLYFATTEPSLEAMDQLVSKQGREVKTAYRYYRSKFLCRTKYDARKPGLFKQEWEGSAMCALGSKVYCGVGRNGGKDKLTCKGVNKRQNKLEQKDYVRVLAIQQSKYVKNKGLQAKRGTKGHRVQASMVQYEVTKRGLGWFYPKRIVQPDGIKTKPLLI